MNTCATCQWMQPYVTGKPELGGECMFEPPIVAVVRGSVVTLRPSVLATDRCSAWNSGILNEADDELSAWYAEAAIKALTDEATKDKEN